MSRQCHKLGRLLLQFHNHPYYCHASSHFARLPAWALSHGCSRGFRDLGCESVPVGVPLVAVHHRAEAGHAVDALDSPASSGLFQAATDQIFTRPFDLSAADRASLGEAI